MHLPIIFIWLYFSPLVHDQDLIAEHTVQSMDLLYTHIPNLWQLVFWSFVLQQQGQMPGLHFRLAPVKFLRNKLFHMRFSLNLYSYETLEG